jgi:hypothetical protein
MRKTFIWISKNRPLESELGVLPENTFSPEFIQKTVRRCFGRVIPLGKSCIDGKDCHIRIGDDENS